MKKQNVLLIFGAFMLIAALGAGSYYLLNRLKSEETTITAKPTLDLPLQSLQSSQNSNTSDLSVKSAQTNNQQQQNTLPTPDQFSVYEEYADIEGIRYIDTVVGNGQEALTGDTVAVVYSGWLTTGLLFDKSPINEAGQIEAFGFTIGGGQVIQGWEIGVAGMKEGGKRRLIIPAPLAYGEIGAADGIIPPNAMLIFDVELAQVQKPTLNN